MTTIAYRNGVIAGDGRETFIEEHESPMINRDDSVKVHRLKDGRLFGAARGSEEIDRLYEALQKGEEKWPCPKLEDINAMVIDTDGTIWVYEGAKWVKHDGDYYSVGSGARFAFPAMDAGADAETAVKIGIARDPYSGGKITVLRLASAALPSRRPRRRPAPKHHPAR